MSTEKPDTYKVDLTTAQQQWDTSTKFKRGIWQFLVKPVYRVLPFRRNRLRVAILRLMGAKIGRSPFIERRIDILMPWNLELDDYVALGHDITILNFAPVRIGAMTVISQNVHLCTGSHDHTHPQFPLVFDSIEVGSESWVASGAFVAPGVTIGRGSVIGANSVVTKDMPEWKVCAGNPCKPIKDREMQTL